MQDHTIELPSDSIAIVLGTRPEIVKLAHVIRLLGRSAKVVHTGQHYDFGLSASFLEAFQIDEPGVYLGVGGMTRGGQIGRAVSALDEFLAEMEPQALVVQGDTNTTLAGAIAANSREIPLVHVEAGLRSRDRRMPEEHNRVLTDHLADLLCAPTGVAEENLLDEGVDPKRIVTTGNTVVEAVRELMPTPEERVNLLEERNLESGRFILSTFHRPENVDDPDRFATVIEQLVAMPYEVVLPLHPRSRIRAEAHGLASNLSRLTVVEPIGYPEFLGLGGESAFLISDSGGVQEEVSVYKRPVVVVRRSTERPEVIGTFARLVEPDGISAVVGDWLGDVEAVHRELADLPSPYGDGSASRRIVGEIGRLVTDD